MGSFHTRERRPPTYGVPREPAILQKAMFDAIKRIFRKRFGKDREFYAVIDRLLGITPDIGQNS